LPLFVRGARPLKLTEAGRIFYAQAKRLLDDSDEIVPLTRKLAQLSDRIVVGFVPSAIYGALPDVIRAFREAAPQTEVALIEMFTIEQIGALKGGRIDVGFGRVRLDSEQVIREILIEEDLIAALPEGHSHACDNTTVPLAALAEDTLIVYPSAPRPSFADQQLSALRDHALEPRNVQEVRELQTALGLVAAQVGVTLVPKSVEGLRARGVVYKPIVEAGITSPIIMSRRQHDESALTALFCSIARSIFSSFQGSR
jgi:LysR family transcriptional regulator, benzoate and cis,cis-muconate-responsive activator of ben and cat genes